jgi:hypothetical protein
MSQFDDELSLDQVDALLAIPQTRSRTTEKERNVKTWFKEWHTSDRPCEVAAHDNTRPREKGMTTVINDVAVCRICYLAELDK